MIIITQNLLFQRTEPTKTEQYLLAHKIISRAIMNDALYTIFIAILLINFSTNLGFRGYMGVVPFYFPSSDFSRSGNITIRTQRQLAHVSQSTLAPESMAKQLILLLIKNTAILVMVIVSNQRWIRNTYACRGSIGTTVLPTNMEPRMVEC